MAVYPWPGLIQHYPKLVEDAQGEIDKAWPGRNPFFMVPIEARQRAVKHANFVREKRRAAAEEARKEAKRELRRQTRRERRRAQTLDGAGEWGGAPEVAALGLP